MADERKTVSQQIPVPEKYAWSRLAKLDGGNLEVQHRHTLENIGKVDDVLGTNVHKTLKKNPLDLKDFDEFTACYKSTDRSKRRESAKVERWKSF